MRRPISIEKTEEIIQHYVKLRYLVACGQINKLYIALEEKAREMGIGIASAWRAVRWAKSIGMVDSNYYFV